MLQYVMWGVSFVTLWLTIVWLNYLQNEDERPKSKRLPKITFGIPAWNEEKTILRTLQSLIDADYPASKKEIIVVNDGSKDDTLKVARAFARKHPQVIVVDKKNGGKASAINEAIDRATGKIFAVMDADTTISYDALKIMVPHFENKNMGAVISRIRVHKPRSFLERMQRFEYVMSSMTRFIMNNFGTLAITHGALSMFSTKTLRKVGKFTPDPNNITEDFEIALRLRSEGYDVIMEPEAISYTRVPNTVNSIWIQRLRWSRGYLYNMWKYRKMILAKKHGLLGTFQLPVNVLAVALLIANVSLISFDFFSRAYDFTARSLTIPDYFWTTVLSTPSLKQLILARNVQVTLPIILSIVLGIYLIIVAHRFFEEKIRDNLAPTLAYTFVMPYFSTLNWVSAINKEARREKRRWR